MTMTGSFNLSGNVPAGMWRTAYIVTTENAIIASGSILASGQQGFDVLGNPVASGGHYQPAILDYETGQIVPIPEPSTLVLAGMALVGLALAWKRRK
jgi:hypothetical protein